MSMKNSVDIKNLKALFNQLLERVEALETAKPPQAPEKEKPKRGRPPTSH